MIEDHWQQRGIAGMIALLDPDLDVRALVLHGSSTFSTDAWSDVDLFLVVRDVALERFSLLLDWLHPLGEIFAYERHLNPDFCTLRLCFWDMRRFDVIIMAESRLVRVRERPEMLVLRRARILFSRLPDLDALLALTADTYLPKRMPAEQFDVLVNAFWFKGMVAVGKVKRGDLLVALHLSLDLIRDCLLVGMLLRDRADDQWKMVIDQLHSTIQPYTPLGILDSLEQSALAFDYLAAVWSPNYRPRAALFRAWIERTR